MWQLCCQQTLAPKLGWLLFELFPTSLRQIQSGFSNKVYEDVRQQRRSHTEVHRFR